MILERKIKKIFNGKFSKRLIVLSNIFRILEKGKELKAKNMKWTELLFFYCY